MRFSFILLGAGSGDRFKSDMPKQYHKIGGKTLIEIIIHKIKRFREIEKIIFVYSKKHQKYLKKINLKNVKMIIGGKTRSQSTFKALNYLKKYKIKGKVLIHDAARPNFSNQLINSILLNSKNNRAIVPILKLFDALKEKRKNKKILNIKKKNFFSTQTPQCFDVGEIYQLHKDQKDKYIDDDFSLFDTNSKIKFITGERRNFKITNQEDFNLLKNLYRSKVKIGIGFDVHKLIVGRKLYLGGVKIPSAVGTLGHSDGDPVLHAIIDAILGACSMGDIGEKFSDKNKKFKNIRSTILLKAIIIEVKNNGYSINNIDINIITQKPKIQKYKKQIVNCIAKICKILPTQINIKGKTTEKLGVIGKEKAIACEVIASVIRYD